MKNNWLILITAGQMQLCGIRAAKALGLNTMAFDGDKHAPGLREADLGIHHDIFDHESIIKMIEEQCPGTPVGALSMCSEAGMPTAARIREHFNLPGPDRELTHRLTNKVAQRTLWDKAGLPIPKWKAAVSMEQGLEAARAIGFPMIIKPADSAGSRGVSKVTAESEISPALEAAFANAKSGEILCESYFQGREYTVETFSIAGEHHIIATTEKDKVPASNGTVASTIYTTDVDASTLKRITETAKNALTALGYTSGVGHTELIFNERGEGIIVETAGRGAGFMLFEKFQPMTSGFAAVRACVQDSAGMAVSMPEHLTHTPCVLSFFPSSPGVFKEVVGMEDIVLDETLDVGLFLKIGDKTVAAHTGDQARLGYVLAAAPTLAEALDKSEAVKQQIHFIITNHD